MVKIERTPTPPPSLATEREKASGSYRGPDVIEQLFQDFHGKCYLCEIDELQSVEVEHLHPHGGNTELKFAWDNLFYSCAHCNSIKNQNKYHDMVLNCCEVEPEALLSQELVNGHVEVKPLNDSPDVVMTAMLITECFEKQNTEIRVIESETRVKALSQTMNVLYKWLGKYKENPSTRTLRTLKSLLDRTSKFAGFTRNYVRTHLDEYPDLREVVNL